MLTCVCHGFFEDAARIYKAPLGGPNTYQGLLSPGNIFYQRKGTASTSEVASRCKNCQRNKLCLVNLPQWDPNSIVVDGS